MKKRIYAAALAIGMMTLCILGPLAPCGLAVGEGEPRSAAVAKAMADANYYMRYTMDVTLGGQTRRVEYEIAVQGARMAERSGLTPLAVAVDTGTASYLVDYGEQTVTEVPGNPAPEFTGTFDFHGLTYLNSGTIPDGAGGGKAYAYEEYATDAGNDVRFCYDGDELVGLQILSGGTLVTAVTVLDLSAQAPDGSGILDVPEQFVFVNPGQQGSGQTDGGGSQPGQQAPPDCVWTLEGTATGTYDIGAEMGLPGMYKTCTFTFQFVNMSSRYPSGQYNGTIYAGMSVDASQVFPNVFAGTPVAAAVNIGGEMYGLRSDVNLSVHQYATYQGAGNIWPATENQDGGAVRPTMDQYVCEATVALPFEGSFGAGGTITDPNAQYTLSVPDKQASGDEDIRLRFIIEPDTVWGDALQNSTGGTRRVDMYVSDGKHWYTGTGTLTRQAAGDYTPPPPIGEGREPTGQGLPDHTGAEPEIQDIPKPPADSGTADDDPLAPLPREPKKPNPWDDDDPLAPLPREPKNPTPWSDGLDPDDPLAPLPREPKN